MKTTIFTAIAMILFSVNTYATRSNAVPSASDSALSMIALPTEEVMHEALTEAIAYENSRKSVSLPTEAEMHSALTQAMAFEKSHKTVDFPDESEMHNALTIAMAYEKSISERNTHHRPMLAGLSK